jgi:hypothetical protein
MALSTSYDNSAAIVMLPPVTDDRLQNRRLRSWLARSDISYGGSPDNPLAMLLREIGRKPPDSGLAALRLWGQTGDRPTRWMAAADPVYLEPRLDHLCLHAVDTDTIAPAELRALMDHLQASLGQGSDCGFGRVGPCCYVSATTPFATATLSAAAIDGCVPNEFLPTGDAAERQRQLQSEIEMALHEHPVNLQRQRDGLPPINSLWLWGGGRAPERSNEAHPPLFSDDPLLGGYWESRGASVESWPGTMARCLDATDAGFVAVVPRRYDAPGILDEVLADLRLGLRGGKLDSLVLLFQDGMRARIRRSHVLRFWKRSRALAAPGAA